MANSSAWGPIWKQVSADSAYTATYNDEGIMCDATSAAFTVTLPTAVGIRGKRFTITKTDSSANAVTVDGNGAETINGSATVSLASQYSSVTIESNNANWLKAASL